MEETSEGKRRGRAVMERLSLEMDRYPRDLLQSFMSSEEKQCKTPASDGEDAEEIELNLGLSLGGRFGVDKTPQKLMRASSIAGSIPLMRERAQDALNRPPVSYPLLMRTSSLPTETEEEWRKRKEIQTLRRLEAKKRRNEKQKNLRGGELNMEEEKRELNVNSRGIRLPSWARNVSRDSNTATSNSSSNSLRGSVMGQQHGSQGSLESLGGSSSGISEPESFIPVQGSSIGSEAKSSASYQSQERSNQEPIGPSGSKTNENSCRTSRSDMESLSKKLDCAENKGTESGTNTMEDMPCVFTKGEGPNGRRVDGILYKYGKGQEVRIMCVCHGSFLSPAEFIKHAGGGDVDQPLKHIVVNPAGASFV